MSEKPTTFSASHEARRQFLNVVVPSIALVSGLALIVAALFVREHSNVLTILGVGAWMHAAVEWAIERRLSDFWARAHMQAESFDGAFSNIKARQSRSEKRLDSAEERLKALDGKEVIIA